MEEEFARLVQQLESRGYSKAQVSQLLGYSGKNAERDLNAIRSGASRKCTLKEAVEKLKSELAAPAAARPISGTSADSDSGDGAAIASAAAASPASAAPSPGDQAATTQKPRATAEPAGKESETDSGSDEEEADPEVFERLVQKLKSAGWTYKQLALALGYKGSPGKKDLDNVRDGKSKTIKLSAAIQKLRSLGAPSATAEPAGKESETDSDSDE